MAGNPNWIKGGASPNPTGQGKVTSDAAKAMARMIQHATGDGAELVEFALAVHRCDVTPSAPPTDIAGRVARTKLADHGLSIDGITIGDRRWAQEWLADRGFGKAVQTFDLSGEPLPMAPLVLSALSDADLEAADRVLREAGIGDDG